jgi:hypothetical protein
VAGTAEWLNRDHEAHSALHLISYERRSRARWLLPLD